MRIRARGLLAMLLGVALALAVGLVPGMAKTARANVTSDDLWVGGTQVTEENKGNVLKGTANDGKVSFSPAEDGAPATLTLDGASITTGHKATLTDGSGSSGFYGIYYTGKDPLTIAVASDSTVDVSREIADEVAGIFCVPSGFTITGEGKLMAKGVTAGIIGKNDVTIDNGVVDATGLDSAIIAREGNVSIINGSTVEANGSINGTHVTINGGTVKASGELWGISGHKVTISGGEVIATASDDGGNGIKSNGNNDESGCVTITGGTVSATGGAKGCGIYTQECSDPWAPGAVKIDSGIASVTASGGKQAIEGTVTNAVDGMGWTDAAGTVDKALIAINADGQVLGEYKKVQFPTPVAKVTTVPEPTNPTYDGNAHPLVTAGTAEGGTMQYSLDGETWSEKVPTGTDVKSYTVWYKVVGDNQHADSEAAYVAVTIAEKPATHRVAVAADPAEGGTAKAEPAEAVAGTSVRLVATAADGWEFAGWETTTQGVTIVDGAFEMLDADVAVTARFSKKEPGPEPVGEPLKLVGAGHVQGTGDEGATEETGGIVIGTTGQSKRLEQFSVSLPEGTDGGIEYRGHLQGIGWDGWVADGAPCGTTGESRRIEAVQITLSGNVAVDYSVWYRVHSQTFGWLGWARDGEAAGTAGQSRRAEAIEVQVLPNGQAPSDYAEGQASYIGAATADVHLQGTGWAGSGSALEFGTTGQSRRLEAISLSTPNQPEAGGVTYEVHAQGVGWMGAVADGALAGTTGQSRRLEAVRVSLTGDMAAGYSVWYRVHSQTYGWLGWAHDGREAGTTGLSRRAEAIDVQILPQGQVPAGYDGSAACMNG